MYSIPCGYFFTKLKICLVKKFFKGLCILYSEKSAALTSTFFILFKTGELLIFSKIFLSRSRALVSFSINFLSFSRVLLPLLKSSSVFLIISLSRKAKPFCFLTAAFLKAGNPYTVPIAAKVSKISFVASPVFFSDFFSCLLLSCTVFGIFSAGVFDEFDCACDFIWETL